MKKILLLSTGGTIASVPSGEGLAPGLTGEKLLEGLSVRIFPLRSIAVSL